MLRTTSPVVTWRARSKLAHKHHIGIYEEDGATLYVHRGLGTTGPPIHLGAAAVVALVTLRVA